MCLPAATTSYFQSAINEIIKEVSPAAIVCFGHSVSTVNHTNCFNTSSSENHHYDLLIVQSHAARYKDHELIDLVNNKFKEAATVNVLSHSEKSVRNALQENHPFFTKIFNEGHMLHQSFDTQFTFDSISSTEPNVDPTKFRQECQRSFDLARSFQQLASHALTNQKHDVAVFLLHQAMEQMCIASIKAHLHYRPSSHNLSKLIDLVGCYLPKAKLLFPCNTKEERDLFDYLRKAYSDVRYNPAFQVQTHIATTLLNRINELQDLTVHKFHSEFENPSNTAQTTIIIAI